MSKFEDHTDDELMQKLTQLRSEDAGEVSDCLLCINEVRSRRMYAARGHKSIYKFLQVEFNFSKNQSYARIRAAEAVAIVPEAESAIREGSTCFTSLASAMIAIYREGKRLRARGEPSVQMPERRSFIQKILRDGDVETAIAIHFPDLLGETTFERKVSNDCVQYALTATPSEILLITRVREILAYKVIDGNWHDIVLEIIQFFLQRKDPLLRKARVEPKAINTKQRGHFSLAIRQALLVRSGGRCEFQTADRRCTARAPLEIDHIVPVAHGGTDSFQNLRLLCREHNQFEAFRKNVGFSRSREIKTDPI